MEKSCGLTAPEEQAKFKEIYPPEEYFSTLGPLTTEIIDYNPRLS